VDRSGLLAELNRPRGVRLTAPTWQVAAILAGLRVATNNPIRSEDRDRGARKNWLADIWGTIGELVAVRRVESIADLAIRHHPIDFHGSVDDVDLTILTSDGPLRLEAKAHLLEGGKSWFMVNQRARARSRERGAIGHIPVIGVLGGGRALVGRLISIEELQGWGVPDKPLKDPAVGIRLSELAESYYDMQISDIERAVRGEPVVSREELTRLAAGAGKDVARWRALLPGLENQSAGEIIETIQRHL
jgi:hypothetical protein